MPECIFILYVLSQQKSADFYREVLDQKPVLNVPGMTEFELGGAKLGLMPYLGIEKIICPVLPAPGSAQSVPRAEVYLYVDEPEAYIQRALKSGAIMVSEYQKRDWGDKAAYLSDLDGHVLVFAKRM